MLARIFLIKMIKNILIILIDKLLVHFGNFHFSFYFHFLRCYVSIIFANIKSPYAVVAALFPDFKVPVHERFFCLLGLNKKYPKLLIAHLYMMKAKLYM